MLEIKSVAAKNFLSYGNKWNKVDLRTGTNLVVGYDVQKQRSNGAGKTSFMEIISFALFGLVSKGLKKSQIINWKNKKSCEAKVEFEKNGIKYTFHRGIKPNFIKVFKGEDEYPINSSVKEFQADLEEQLIGMDFKVFNSLIYSNPNNSISLLDTPKAQKRAFIEKQFNLTDFSALNKLNNEHIRKIDLEIHDIKQTVDKNKEIINDLTFEKGNIKDERDDIDIDSYTDQKKDLKESLDKLSDITEEFIQEKKIKLLNTKKEQQDKQKDFDELDKKKIKLKETLIKTITTIKGLKKQKDDIGDLSVHLEKLEKEKKKLLLCEDVEERLQKKKEGLPSIETQLDNLKLCYQEHTDIIKERQMQIKTLNIDELEGKSSCPTCHQPVDYDSIKDDMEKDIKMHQGHIDQEIEKRDIIDNGIKELKDSLEKRKVDIEEFEDKVKNKQLLELSIAKLEKYANKQDEIDEIDKKIKELSNYTDQVKLIEQFDKDLKIFKKSIDNYNISIKSMENSLDDANKKFSLKKDTINKLDLLNKELLHKKETIKKCNERIEIKTKKIVELRNKCLEADVIILDKIKELDHLKYIKDMLKDENIKQFAIGHMIPIIEKQANYYLGEAGFGFYLKIDNWLDAKIKGPGISDCSFASMSGGERKSIDLAMKFAIMDISMARIPDFPDILILDELLDSSVDSFGIQQLINIVKVKQEDKNLKVFLISHRQEMEELEPDNIYTVTKDNGYSTITVKEA